MVSRAAKGDTEAFRILFEANHRELFSCISRLTISRDIAEDLTQECFLSLISHPEKFDHRRGSLRGYLYGIARNLLRERWRAEKRELPLNEEDGNDEPREFVASPCGLEAMEASQLVHTAISRLPILQREVIVLFELQEFPLSEIAEILKCDVGTIKSRLHRARERLRKELASYRGVGRVPQKGIVHESFG